MSAATTTVIASSTIWVEPRPSTSGPSSQIDATAIAGIVSPMLAIAEPSARLKLVCMRSRRALRTAASVSGSSTSSAITTPTRGRRRADASTASSIAGDSTLASPTTATSATQQQAEADERGPARTAARRAPRRRPPRRRRQEVVAVADGLDEHEQAVERERGDRGERELRRRELRAGPAGRERRQHEA